MKKILFLPTILATITCVYAVTIGIEPPASYINNLKNCTSGTYSTKSNSMIIEYKIKGKLPNGRCEIQMSEKYDWDNPQTEKDMKYMLGMFSNMVTDMAGEKKATDKQLDDAIKEIKQSKGDITTCRFSQKERNSLIKAYNLHDSKQEVGEVKRDSNGNIVSFKGSFSTDKMSSYDNLMIKYSTICKTSENGKTDTSKVYACEYADTTCYYSDLGNGGSSMSCTKNEPDGISTFKLMDKIREHVKAGYCERVF